ncbi:hypothetical protein GBA52_023160 [Prunus armeniaca]|nr:hypothetical protein GBA52_023160 [Prunus armeniaca]
MCLDPKPTPTPTPSGGGGGDVMSAASLARLFLTRCLSIEITRSAKVKGSTSMMLSLLLLSDFQWVRHNRRCSCKEEGACLLSWVKPLMRLLGQDSSIGHDCLFGIKLLNSYDSLLTYHDESISILKYVNLIMREDGKAH